QGGIQFTWDFSTRPWSIARRDPHPRPYNVPNTPTNELSNSSSCAGLISERLYRAIQFLRIERDSYLPNNQHYSSDLARQQLVTSWIANDHFRHISSDDFVQPSCLSTLFKCDPQRSTQTLHQADNPCRFGGHHRFRLKHAPQPYRNGVRRSFISR